MICVWHLSFIVYGMYHVDTEQCWLSSRETSLFVLFFLSCQASDWEKLQKTLADALEHYNELHAVMDLVLFEEAIQHV